MTRAKVSEWRKQEIRAAATRCFVRRGFGATRLADIAREAKLSKGGVFFHYRAKDALFHEIVDGQLRALQARWSSQPVRDQPADKTLARLIVAHLRTTHNDPEQTRLQHLLVSMSAEPGEFRDKLEHAFSLMRSHYAGVIQRGMREGAFRAGNADELARCVLAMVQGLACQSATHPDGKLGMSPHTAAELVLQMLRPPPKPRADSRPVAATLSP